MTTSLAQLVLKINQNSVSMNSIDSPLFKNGSKHLCNRKSYKFVMLCLSLFIGEIIASVLPIDFLNDFSLCLRVLRYIVVFCASFFLIKKKTILNIENATNSELKISSIIAYFASFLFGLSIVCETLPISDLININQYFARIDRGYLKDRIKLSGSGKLIEFKNRSLGVLRVIIDIEGSNNISGRYIAIIPDLPWASITNLNKGDCVRFTGILSLQDIDTKLYRDPFSFASYLHRRGYVAIISNADIEACNPLSNTRLHIFDRFLSQLLNEVGISDGLSIIIASLFGQADLLGDQVKELFQFAGIMHLLVISGFHLLVLHKFSKIVLFFIFSFSLFLRVHNLVSNLSTGVSLSIVYVYSSLIGFSPPIVRALFSLCLYAIFKEKNRKFHLSRIILLSLVFVNIIWPACIFEAGVQFTFAALIGLNLGNKLYLWLQDKYNLKQAILKSSIEHLVACFVCWLFTSPISYLWFGQINMISPFINAVVAFPFTIVTVIGGGIAILLWTCSCPYAVMLVKLVIWLTECIVDFVRIFRFS